MTITREQLELAAKAAGIEGYWFDAVNAFRIKGRFDDTWQVWLPQTDHGQLHDLAMACKIVIDPNRDNILYEVTDEQGRIVRSGYKSVNCQDFPALAEAVIRAAAEQQMAKEGK